MLLAPGYECLNFWRCLVHTILFLRTLNSSSKVHPDCRCSSFNFFLFIFVFFLYAYLTHKHWEEAYCLLTCSTLCFHFQSLCFHFQSWKSWVDVFLQQCVILCWFVSHMRKKKSQFSIIQLQFKMQQASEFTLNMFCDWIFQRI